MEQKDRRKDKEKTMKTEKRVEKKETIARQVLKTVRKKHTG